MTAAPRCERAGFIGVDLPARGFDFAVGPLYAARRRVIAVIEEPLYAFRRHTEQKNQESDEKVAAEKRVIADKREIVRRDA